MIELLLGLVSGILIREYCPITIGKIQMWRLDRKHKKALAQSEHYGKAL